MPRQPLTDAIRIRPDLRGAVTLRMQRLPHDAWILRSASILVAGLIPVAALGATSHIELVVYALVGSMTALFGHGLPYAQRARTHAGLVAAIVLASACALALSAALTSTLALIAAASVFAAATKVAVEASRVGPPGAIIPTFLFSGFLFVGESWAEIPVHVALIAGAGAVAWLVVMAPALWNRRGPERRTLARMLLAAGALHEAPHDAQARRTLAAAIHDAWGAATMSGATGAERRTLEAHIVAAERVLTDPTVRGSAGSARADARAIRRGRGPFPPAPLTADESAEIAGAHAERAAPRAFADRHPILAAFRPGSPHAPFFWRVLLGCAAAAIVAHLVGVGRPFWAVVTAASLIQPNLLLTWRRAPQRTIGAVLGVGLFALVAPVALTDPLVAAVLVLVFNATAEFLIPRSYLVGQIVVTPMALIISEFGRAAPVPELVVDRLLDTVIGSALGLAAALAIRNGHVRRRTKELADDLERASAGARSAADGADPAAREAARRGLISGLARLRRSFQQSDGEWWAHAVDEARVIDVERQAHRALAALEAPGGPR
ncbi:FUSC family protein [Microbacterium sp. ZXX196]|uniref:FUSC family protein n=1 Tax=Microbacterium sp. ZXX196 TaxID=2609291 RepID=UPI0012B8B12C|nr:FUSC family protein [Microbacterium sp. ZXX196]